MSKMLKNTVAIGGAALRASLLVLVMTGPVWAVTYLKAENGTKFSGAGLVLVVSIERNA